MNKVLYKGKRKIKVILILSDMVTLNLQWSKIWKILLKVLKMLSEDISILRKTKYFNNAENGLNLPKRDKLHIPD